MITYKFLLPIDLKSKVLIRTRDEVQAIKEPGSSNTQKRPEIRGNKTGALGQAVLNCNPDCILQSCRTLQRLFNPLCVPDSCEKLMELSWKICMERSWNLQVPGENSKMYSRYVYECVHTVYIYCIQMCISDMYTKYVYYKAE